MKWERGKSLLYTANQAPRKRMPRVSFTGRERGGREPFFFFLFWHPQPDWLAICIVSIFIAPGVGFVISPCDDMIIRRFLLSRWDGADLSLSASFTLPCAGVKGGLGRVQAWPLALPLGHKANFLQLLLSGFGHGSGSLWQGGWAAVQSLCEAVMGGLICAVLARQRSYLSDISCLFGDCPWRFRRRFSG